MRLGRRFNPMVAAVIAGMTGVVLLADPGAAAAVIFGARSVAKTAVSHTALDAPVPKVANVTQLPALPAGDEPYPVVVPQIRAGAVHIIESAGVSLNFQNVSYGDPTEHNSYDVYWPVASAPKRRGAVLMIHGGSWVMGRKELDTSYAMAAARAGYVAAAMDYSTLPDVRAWPAAAQDTFAVADSFRSRAEIYGFDPAHLVAAGWSAGGNLAELLGTVGRGTDRVAAVVSWSGISDMPALGAAPSTVPLSHTLAKMIGCSATACPQIWQNGSPVSHVGPGDAPTLMFAGSREFVPTTQSSELQGKLQAAGITADLHILDTDHHGGDLRPETMGALLDWLHRYADPSATAE